MEVIRKVKKDVKKVQVGDQIALGRYTATAVAQDVSGTTFCFDQVYGETSTKTPYDEKRMKALYKSKAMESVRDKFVPLLDDVANVDPLETPLLFFRSPTAEEIFARQHLRSVELGQIVGCTTRWKAMKDGSYRAAFDVNGVARPYWTESMAKEDSQAYRCQGTNVIVRHNGSLDYSDTGKENSYVYWRPVFKLKV